MIVKTVKRLMDVFLGTLFIILFSPLMIAIAIAIKLGSRGPILYTQQRAGTLPSDGNQAQTFSVYKFRTMAVDAEAKTGAVLSCVNDPRVTRIGYFLRRTRLDELPQFFNVLMGHMSIVGPRPERPELMEPLNSSIPFFEERLRFVKPGITGLAQIKLKYDGKMSDDCELLPFKSELVNPFQMEDLEGATADGMRLKLLYDLVYSSSLERFTSFVATDLAIMLKTPIVMFMSKTGR
jgi:lipopolysaccharide/colanic/teichoic acid biosynthesis glycosyltransferase